MKKIISLITSLILAVMLVGCQATPDTQIVVQKDTEQMLEKAQTETSDDTSLRERLHVPDAYTVSDEYYEGKLCISANDAEIVLPDKTGLPTVRVTSGEFDQDRVNALYNVLVGGAKMYTRSVERTKAQIEKDILSKKEYINRIKGGASIDGESPDLELEEQNLKELEEAYKTAPESIESIEADATLCPTKDGKSTKVNLSGRDADGNSILFVAENNIDSIDNHAIFSFQRGEPQSELYPMGPYSMQNNTLSDKTLQLAGLTVEDAKSQALAFFSGIGEGNISIADMQVCYLVPSSFFDTPSAGDQFYGLSKTEQIKEKELENYAVRALITFSCYRNMNGIAVTSDHISLQTGVSEGDELPEYKKWWPYERISVSVSHRGIESVQWSDPLDITETITDNTALLPFDKIDEVFRQIFKVKYSEMLGEGLENGGLEYTGYDIQKVVLTLRRIQEQNASDAGLLVPVWDFYGSETIEYSGEPRTTLERELPILTINAIDDSVIDLTKGY